MKQNCDCLQMYLCRIRFRETIPKYRSICPPSASITSWRRLEKSLYESRMTFCGILAYSFRSLTFRNFKFWWWRIETLPSSYDQIPKSRTFRSGEDGAHSSLIMKCAVSESHSRVFLVPCDGAVSFWKDQGRFLKFSRAQDNNAPIRMSSR